MIIDAENLIVGRLGTIVAKKALEGETVDIVNAEKAVMTGTPDKIFAKYKQKREMGAPRIGPFYSRMPDRFLRRAFRGMLPYSKTRGRDAYARIKCHVGVPKEFSGKFTDVAEEFNLSKVTRGRSVTVGQICKYLGAKL